MLVAVLVVGCTPPRTTQDIQRDEQEKSLREGARQTGIPAIKNFREAKLAKDIYELRDQTGLVTYTYTFSELNGVLTFFCQSIGYPIPYAVQFTSPETMQTYNVARSEGSTHYYGAERLPQPEPNGLFSPASAEGTWVMCKDPKGDGVRPVYIEPRVIVSQFRLK
jgi:hypothetical protein